MKERIRITIDEDGKVTADIIGGHGSSCSKEIEEINKLCGGQAKITKKPEYYVGTGEKTKIKQVRQ